MPVAAPAEKAKLFFHARATHGFKRNRFYRIYLTYTELLFVQSGPGKMDHVAMAFAGHFGLVGALIGGLIGWFIASRAKKDTEARQKQLDDADEQELSRLIDEDKHSFRAELSELSEVSIDPKSVWHQIAYSSSPDYVGVLGLQHQTRGKMKLEFLSNEDMRLAIDTLPELLPGKVSINVVWNEKKKSFGKTR